VEFACRAYCDLDDCEGKELLDTEYLTVSRLIKGNYNNHNDARLTVCVAGLEVWIHI
jgi:hypothetical protein